MNTCESCDWWCYGTWPGNTCDKWERTVFEADVPDEVIARLLHEPTAADLDELEREIEGLEGSYGR